MKRGWSGRARTTSKHVSLLHKFRPGDDNDDDVEVHFAFICNLGISIQQIAEVGAISTVQKLKKKKSSARRCEQFSLTRTQQPCIFISVQRSEF